MPAEELTRLLDNEHIPYRIYQHPVAFSAQEIAASTHISGKMIAKSIIVKCEDTYAMVVLPATTMIDFDQLERVVGHTDIKLASEDEFRELFPDCETGAMPPFGNIYGMKVFVDEQLAEEGEIAFNVGTHSKIMIMSCKDFLRIVKPRLTHFSRGEEQNHNDGSA